MPVGALLAWPRARAAALCALAVVAAQPTGPDDPALPGPVRSEVPSRALNGAAPCSDALIAAARYGDEQQLRETLRSESANCVDGLRQTPLHVAVAAGQRNATLVLLGAGAGLSRDVRGRGPLHAAAEAGHAGLVELMLQYAGAYSEMTDTMGRTALHLAALSSRLAAAGELLDRGARTGARDGEGRTPLHYSARSDSSLELSRLLLARGAKTEASDILGQNPLHLACLENQPLTVNALQGAGADLWAMDNAGWNPLMLAAAGSHEPLVTTLVFGVLQPKQLPAPDPALFEHQESEGIGGIPGWLLAVAAVSLCACLMMCEVMRRLRR